MDELKLAFLSDPHYYSPKLGITGKAYERRSSTDQKCLAESGAIIDAAFDIVGSGDADAVLIAGDLSNDGEKVSHEEMLEKIKKLAEKKPVYVVYATHDWCCSEDAAMYEGDSVLTGVVETMTPAELREMYFDYGVKNCISEYILPNGSSSYCAKIKDGYRLLGINDDKNGKNQAGYSPDHLEWILGQIADAKAAGDSIIAMQHHLIMPTVSELVSGGMLIGDWRSMAETLADAGLEFIFTGHSHMQRTSKLTSAKGNTLYQINLGSICGYPAPYTDFKMNAETAAIDVSELKQFEYNGVVLRADFIKDHTLGLVKNLIDNAEKGKDALTEQLACYGMDFSKVGIPYGIIKFGAKKLNSATIKKAASLVNFFTFGKGIDKKAAKEIGNNKLINHVYEIYLAVFDGSRHPYEKTSPVYKVVSDVASLPKRVCKALPIKALKTEKVQKVLGGIEATMKELISPENDNWHAVIKRRDG